MIRYRKARKPFLQAIPHVNNVALRSVRNLLGDMVDRTEALQADLICISLVQGIQAHLNELETRLRLLSEPDSVTKERQTA